MKERFQALVRGFTSAHYEDWAQNQAQRCEVFDPELARLWRQVQGALCAVRMYCEKKTEQ